MTVETSIGRTLVAGGELGRLIRATDWTETPLGCVETWPEGLAAVLGVCLGSRIPSAVCWGPELCVLYNDAWIPIAGAHHPWILGRPARDLWPTLCSTLERVRTSGEPAHSIELVRERHLDLSFTPIHGAGARVAGVFVTAAALDHDRDATRAKDEFLAMLGHELRNPLAPISTALELMRLRGLASREQEVIERQVEHLARLVDDLLDISRITRGTIELRRVHAELGDIVRRGVEVTSPLLEQRAQRIACDMPAEGLPIEGDPDRLAQVVSNLVANASKYSELGTTIEIRGERAGDRVVLRVRDHGIGIEPVMLERIFDAFVQQAQSLERSKGGLGLGLAIVRNLVELHGGEVRAYSDGPGHGSELVVSLPFAAAIAPPARMAAEVPDRPASERNRVLVVDDNIDSAEMISDWLLTLGFEVRTAHDGPSAIAVARSFRPDICLLDIGLPVMDGYELARHLRASSDLPRDGKIIAVTGYGQDADRRRSIEAGFDAHLVKPVNLAALARVIQT